MEVEIISKETIKPSSPTPQLLKIFKLSLLDQLITSPYAPIILFYPTNDDLDTPKRLQLLKKSLSETLTSFYPLAGKIRDDLSIDCNDEGANFLEARVNCSLHEFLSKPELLLVNKFLPCSGLDSKESTAGNYVTNIQVNIFDCGGIAIGLCISHRILDGESLSTFLKAWSNIANNSLVTHEKNITNNEYYYKENPINPNFVANSLFPTNDLWLRDSSIVMWDSLLKKGKCVTRRFVFNASSIASLKAQATSLQQYCPTRVEVVSAFIWKCTMSAAASKQEQGLSTTLQKRHSLLTHLVNLRKRMSPPLPENSIGNLLWIAAAQAQCNIADGHHKPELQDLVGEMREAISRIDGEFVKKLRGEKGNSMMFQSVKEIGELGSKGGVDYLGFSSWCKFGFYEADFGWGKPVWVSCMVLEGSVFMNLVILVDTRLGDGIEACVCLDEEEMAILVHEDHELLKYASLDPSPISDS